jgi:hypothetical protein
MDQGTFLWLAFITAGQIIGMLASLYSMRRRPSTQEELYRDFVSRAACDARHCREAAERQAIAVQLSDRLKRGDALFQAVERALGRIEGQLEIIMKHWQQ